MRLRTCFQILGYVNASGFAEQVLGDSKRRGLTTIDRQPVDGDMRCLMSDTVLKADAKLLPRPRGEEFDFYSFHFQPFSPSDRMLLISEPLAEGSLCDELSKSINLEIARFAAWDSFVLRPSQIKVPGTISDGDTCEIAFPQGSASWEFVNGHWAAGPVKCEQSFAPNPDKSELLTVADRLNSEVAKIADLTSVSGASVGDCSRLLFVSLNVTKMCLMKPDYGEVLSIAAQHATAPVFLFSSFIEVEPFVSGDEMQKGNEEVSKLQTAGTCTFIAQGIMAHVFIKASVDYSLPTVQFSLEAQPQITLKCHGDTQYVQWTTARPIRSRLRWSGLLNAEVAHVEFSKLTKKGCFELMQQAELLVVELRTICVKEPFQRSTLESAKRLETIHFPSPSIPGVTVTQERNNCFFRMTSGIKLVTVFPGVRSDEVVLFSGRPREAWLRLTSRHLGPNYCERLATDYQLDFTSIEDLNNYYLSLRESLVQNPGQLSEGDTCSIQIGKVRIANSTPIVLSWIFQGGAWAPREIQCKGQDEIDNPVNAQMIEAARILNSNDFDVTPYKRISLDDYDFGNSYIFHAGCLRLLQTDLNAHDICT